MGNDDNTEIEFTTEIAEGDLGNPKVIVQEVRDLVKQGVSVDEAARHLGLDLKRNGELRKALRRLVAEVGDIPAAVQKELVRGTRLKVMLKNVHSDDTTEQKLALSAAKQIASDPDIGLNIPAQVIALVDMGSLQEIIEKLPDDDILEADFEEVKNDDS